MYVSGETTVMIHFKKGDTFTTNLESLYITKTIAKYVKCTKYGPDLDSDQ